MCEYAVGKVAAEVRATGTTYSIAIVCSLCVAIVPFGGTGNLKDFVGRAVGVGHVNAIVIGYPVRWRRGVGAFN